MRWFFIFAKIQPILKEMREKMKSPGLFRNVEKVIHFQVRTGKTEAWSAPRTGPAQSDGGDGKSKLSRAATENQLQMTTRGNCISYAIYSRIYSSRDLRQFIHISIEDDLAFPQNQKGHGNFRSGALASGSILFALRSK